MEDTSIDICFKIEDTNYYFCFKIEDIAQKVRAISSI